MDLDFTVHLHNCPWLSTRVEVEGVIMRLLEKLLRFVNLSMFSNKLFLRTCITKSDMFMLLKLI